MLRVSQGKYIHVLRDSELSFRIREECLQKIDVTDDFCKTVVNEQASPALLNKIKLVTLPSLAPYPFLPIAQLSY